MSHASHDCFSDRTTDYVAHRPSYPRAVFVAALEGLPVPARCADVGCGTGISARGLATEGAIVVGIDPNESMLEAARKSSSIEYRTGSAESTGLADSSIDLVLCAQAFHWFDRERALAEFRRVLSGRGRVALLWNIRDESHHTTAAYSAIARLAQDLGEARGKLVRRSRGFDGTAPGFSQPRRIEFANPQVLDRAAWHGRRRSASYFPTDGPLAQSLTKALDAAFDEHAIDDRVTLCHRTELTLLDRT